MNEYRLTIEYNGVVIHTELGIDWLDLARTVHIEYPDCDWWVIVDTSTGNMVAGSDLPDAA